MKMKLGIFANCEKPNALPVLRRLAQVAGKLGVDIFASPAIRAHVGAGTEIAEGEYGATCDMVLCVGGDGSVLHTLGLLGDAAVPVAALNAGTLGFMSCAPADQLETLLECLTAGRYRIEERIMLSAAVQGNPSYHALNDVVVARGASGRIITLDLTVNGNPVTSYKCDGLIVSTPTGSTAYSLSAGGPILMPETRAIVVSVICPHTLSSRPLVLPDSAVIEVTVRKTTHPLLLSIDGRDESTLPPGEKITIARSPRIARIVQLHHHNPFDALRVKLGWKGTPP